MQRLMVTAIAALSVCAVASCASNPPPPPATAGLGPTEGAITECESDPEPGGATPIRGLTATFCGKGYGYAEGNPSARVQSTGALRHGSMPTLREARRR